VVVDETNRWRFNGENILAHNNADGLLVIIDENNKTIGVFKTWQYGYKDTD
jgi:hypothetical protein